MSSLWIWSALSNYSTNELEEHKIYLKKVIEFRKKLQVMDLTHVPHYYAGGFHMTYELEQNIKEIDEELERRKHQLYIFGNEQPHELGKHELYITNFPPVHDLTYLVNTPTVTAQTANNAQNLDSSKELKKKDKKINELKKRLEEMSKELQEERNSTDRYQKIITEHKCKKSFTSEVGKE